MSVNRAGSTLAVDFGSVHTRAILIDLVEGAYQVVAQGEERTTIGFPSGNLAVGLRRVLDQIGQMTGRRFMGSNQRVITPEQADRSGVDVFLTTASIGRPLRTVLIGLVPNVSIASGFRAMSGTYAEVVETITLEDTRSEEELLNALILSNPDLIFITGGTEAGARAPVLQLARTVSFALPLMTSQRTPSILYAGNSALVPEIRALFDGKAPLFVAPNIRPSLDEEELEAAQLQLGLAFNATSAGRGAGFEEIGSMSRFGILPNAQSYNLIAEYLGQAVGDVVAVDVGSAVSTMSVSFGRQVSTDIRTDLGLGHSAATLLETVGLERVRNWIPFNISDSELLAYALNKTTRPGVVPETLRELYIEHAFLRAAIQTMLRDAGTLSVDARNGSRQPLLPPVSWLIGAGAALTQTGRPGLGALLLLDALNPVGMTALYADSIALIPALGALARVNPAAVVQVLEGNGLERLGVAFNLSGTPRTGRAAMRVKITPASGKPISHDIEGGHLWIYPLPLGTRVKVEVRALGRGLSFGGKPTLRAEVEGGSVGLIFDARGRPLPLAVDVAARAAQMPLWFAEATGDEVRPIDAKWLEPLPKADALTGIPAKPGKQRKEKPPKAEKQRGKQQEPDAQQAPPEPATEAEEEDIDELRNLFS